jgi:hypothetical protein
MCPFIIPPPPWKHFSKLFRICHMRFEGPVKRIREHDDEDNYHSRRLILIVINLPESYREIPDFTFANVEIAQDPNRFWSVAVEIRRTMNEILVEGEMSRHLG